MSQCPHYNSHVDAFILSTSTDPLGTAGHIPSSLKFMIFVGDVDKWVKTFKHM